MSSTMESTVLLSGADVERWLDMGSCIAAVEDAFRRRGEGIEQPGGVLGVPGDRGGYHIKAATLGDGSRYFAAKLNANFPDNPRDHNLPTIQGLVLLSDTRTGTPLAVMESGSLTRLRTAAASAVAARYLANPSASTLAVIGCGAQAEPHIRAISNVRRLECVTLFDARPGVAARLAHTISGRYDFAILTADTLERACAGARIIATCTTAREPFLCAAFVLPGTFVAAVGADAPEKRELELELLRQSVMVTDHTPQCAQIGELHHAIEAGAMDVRDVRTELGGVVAGVVPGRLTETETIIFDSTGIPIEDVAAAGIVYERARHDTTGARFAFRA